MVAEGQPRARETKPAGPRPSRDEPSGPIRGGKTLDTALRLLWLLRDNPDGLTHAEIGQVLSINRAATYRLLRTLMAHHLVQRDGAARYQLGVGVIELSLAVQPRLRSVAMAELQLLADDCNATAFLTVLDGADGVVVAVAEPLRSSAHVAYRVGVRHPIDRSAAGLAILAGRPPQRGERRAVTEARRLGYAVTSGELQAGAWGLAVPAQVEGQPASASVGIVTLTRPVANALVDRVTDAARTIIRLLQT